jgi:hypothetical protein
MQYATEGRFLLLWLCSAALVTVLRCLNVADLGYDLTLQIQAAQHLLAGKGLALYESAGRDLAEPKKLFTLTYFPCGYSLFAAALIAMGARVGMVVKVLGAAGTLLGWWGWGKLAYLFFSEGLQRSPLWTWAGCTIAMVSPLLFTAPWQGTDLFLWAAVPWVVQWVVRASDEHLPGGRWLDGLAGAVCGLCVLMRYASLFLVVYAACLMLWQSRLRLRGLARRWACFGLGLLPALALQVYINHVLSSAPVSPGGLTFDRGIGVVVPRAWHGLPSLRMVIDPWVFWLPGKEMDLFRQVAGPWPWHSGILLAVVVVLGLGVGIYGLKRSAAARDPRRAALGLFIMLPLVLWGCTMLGNFAYGAVQRYYWPIRPLSVFVAYALASLPGVTKRGRLTSILHTLGVVYVTGYIAMSLTCLVLFFVPGERGANQHVKLMGTSYALHHGPSLRVNYEFSPARRFVMGLLKEQPDTLLLTSRGQWFYADPTVDRSRLSELTSCGRLPAKSLSGPARMIMLTFDEGQPQALWYTANGQLQRADCFEQLPDLHLLQRFPEEGLKVLEARVPAGMRVILGP